MSKRGTYTRTEGTKKLLRAKYETNEARMELGKLISDALAKNKEASLNIPGDRGLKKTTRKQLIDDQIERGCEFIQFEDRTICDSDNVY
jgi:hypothetical protein